MRGKALWLGISLATIGCAAHAQTTRVEADKTVAGHDIQLITAASGIGVNVVIDGQMFESDGDDMYDSIFGTYDVGGTPVVLIEHGDGGNACPGTFTALILGSPITTTKMFGSCSDVPAVSVNGAQLIVSTPQMNGQGTEVDVVTKDGLNATETVAEQLIGPAYTPGMDLAAALSDPPAGVPYHTKAAVEKLKAVLGDDLYSTVSQFVVGNDNQPTAVGDYAVYNLCMPHACGSMSAHLVFDHGGNAWVAVNNNANWTWYGNPPVDVIATLAAN